MKKQPLISVIIPTYKRSPYLIKKSITSAVNQTYKTLEIIIVDDSPNDYENRLEVEQFLESFNDSRIIYIKHEKNLGANAARNTGIKVSSGNYYAFLDDDDEWELNKLELQIEKALNKNIGLVYCKGRIFNENEEYIKPINNKLLNGKIYENLMNENIIGGNSFVLISKEAINMVGLFDEKMQSNQDWDLFLRIAQKFEIDFVNQYLVNYYIHSEERITSNASKKLQGWKQLYKKYENYLQNHPDVENSWNLKMIIVYLKNNYYFKAIKLIIKTFLYSPKLFFVFIKNTYKAMHNKI